MELQGDGEAKGGGDLTPLAPPSLSFLLSFCLLSFLAPAFTQSNRRLRGTHQKPQPLR